MARKVTVNLFDDKRAKTTGIPIEVVARELRLWPAILNRPEELRRKFVHWLDRAKYDLATVWEWEYKTYRVFKHGYLIQDQIETIINRLAGDGNEDVTIGIVEIAHELDLGTNVQGGSLFRTIYHNIKSSRLPTLADTNYWTGYLTADNERHEAGLTDETDRTAPILPSVYGRIFKSNFDHETDGQ